MELIILAVVLILALSTVDICSIPIEQAEETKQKL
jgi:hypothetical protein